MQVRAALLHDLPELDRIAVEAKANWGYTQEQLARWKFDLTTPPETLASRPTYVAEIEGRVVGFGQLDPQNKPWELVALWVRPSFMRQGVGTTLLRKLRMLAQESGVEEIHIDADPNALHFYKACGAAEVGSVPAPLEVQPTRVRPQLRLPTGGA
jgi:N-acetylglutamate synthase-like GNAT family acetyltransferase